MGGRGSGGFYLAWSLELAAFAAKENLPKVKVPELYNRRRRWEHDGVTS